jgi:hypothetical protein
MEEYLGTAWRRTIKHAAMPLQILSDDRLLHYFTYCHLYCPVGIQDSKA